MDLSVQSCVRVCVEVCVHACMSGFAYLAHYQFWLQSFPVHYGRYQSCNLLREVSAVKKKNAGVATYELHAVCWSSNGVQLCLGLSHSRSSVHSHNFHHLFWLAVVLKGLNISSARHVSLSVSRHSKLLRPELLHACVCLLLSHHCGAPKTHLNLLTTGFWRYFQH